MPAKLPEDLHLQLGVTPARLAAILANAVAALPTQRFYVFRTPPGSTTGANAPAKPRTIPAFLSPDDAMTFAQRQTAQGEIRVRAISATDLLGTMLATPTIGSILFLQTMPLDPEERKLPPGIIITRASLLDLLQREQENEDNRQDAKDAKNEEG